tara:strand:- start:148 stop:858 length:711 start_codon:yes stop_codon:yes gene_type:complete
MGGSISTNSTFGSTNFDGNELSIVQTNATAGFSILTWTGGSNVQTHTFGHELGVKPAMVIHKRRGSTSDWSVWHQGISSPNDNFITLNNTNATSASPSWEQPTTTVLQPYIGSTGDTWVSYVFAEVEGYSKFGSYTGNTSADGVFIYTGFRPSFFLWKSATSAGDDWFIVDSTRSTFNVIDKYNRASQSNAEQTFTLLDFVSNGIKIRASSGAINDGTTFIYMAFAEQPFKFSNAR